MTSFASVSEASNEAKKAILRLLPHGVKYQTYIDEGFDASLIKSLFKQLNLPIDSASSALPEKPIAIQDKGAHPPGNQTSQQTHADTMAKKQEERKDKIARLMAEKKAKLAAASSNSGPAAEPRGGESSAGAVTTPSAKPPITRAEKDRLLQQKVEALRNKAREAKKLAQKSATMQTPVSDAAQKATPPQVSTMISQPLVATPSTSGTPLSSASHSVAPSPGVSNFPSVPQAPQINQRKRPVAADFMDFSPLPVKRPSLANRQNSSLVISISDDEDDEDVEMEVDSATEDSPASLPQTLTLTRRGPSIRDFPPLSNVKNTRQVHSPVSGLSASGVKNANADLETKERAILEMQKKIKELEAKKEAKARSGNVTPRSPSTGGVVLPEQAVQTPVRRVESKSDADDKTTPSAQLIQEAEAASASIPKLAIPDSQSEYARHVRVSSALLSGKSAKALEKAERLRRMQEEMRKLEAEIEEEEDDHEDRPMAEEVESSALLGRPKVSQEMVALTGHESSKSMMLYLRASGSWLTGLCEDPGAEVRRVESFAITSNEEHTASSQISSDAQAMHPDSPPDASDSFGNTAVQTQSTILRNLSATHTPVALNTDKLQDASTSINSFQSRKESEFGDDEPPEPKIDRPVGGDSPTFGAALAEVAHSATQQYGEVAETAREVLVDSSNPIDTSLTYSKTVTDTSPTRQASFAPYESPLRYYHAYRFHPNYINGIQGGLKSLTYSNRIDPNKEMCPDEWEGNDCPRGDACQFQHFQSIIAPGKSISSRGGIC